MSGQIGSHLLNDLRIVAAVRETGLKLPLVVRLEGNNVLAGNRTLGGSGLTIIRGDSMADAARKVVEAVK